MRAPTIQIPSFFTGLSPRVRGTLLVVLAALLVIFVVPALAPHTAPLGLLLQGAELGAVNGLLALGLVLTYKSTRIINFAYGAMGGLAGTIGVMLDLGEHWNWFIALGAGLVIGALLGAGVDLVMRRFFNAPRLIAMVATIGLAQALGGIQLLVPGWFHGPPLVGGLPTPLTRFHVNIHPVLFNGDDLLIACVVPVVLLGLGWFLLRTDYGVAVRSVADNSERALLLGIPVKRLGTLVWIIAGGLAALTVMVNAPSQGLTLSAAAGPTLLLPALAAAVIARMENLPVAFGAGVGLGIINSVVGFNVRQESVTDVVFLAVILVALLLQKKKAGRANDAGDSWLATGVLKPIPDILKRLPEVIAGRALIGAAIAAVLIATPLLAGPGTTLEFTVAIIFGIVAVSLVCLSGWSGNISLGQFAFAGIGGVIAGDLIEKSNVDFFVSLLCAAVGGAVLAVLVGLPALLIRGMFLAATTLALAVAVDSFFLNPTNFASIIPQGFLRPVLWKRFDLANGRTYYFFCLAILLVAVVFVKGLRKARAGRVLLANRDNQNAASAMAVPSIRVKLVGFMLAGSIAGIAGALYATSLRGVGFHTFDSSLSLVVFSMAVIGGLSSISGALLGVALIEIASDALPQYQLLFTGFGLLVVLLVLPGGLGVGIQFVRDRVLRVVAERRGLLVPSLVADRRDDPGSGADGHDAHAPKEDSLLAAALTGDGPSAGNGHGSTVRYGVGPDVDQPGAIPDPFGTGAPARPAAPVGTGSVSAPVPEFTGAPTGQQFAGEPTGELETALGPEFEHTRPLALRCQAVEVSYGPVQILFGIDLDVAEGEIVALLGTNGAGKSTLLKGITGLAKVGGGSVEFAGRNITNKAPNTVAHLGLSLMPGGRGIFPTLTVEENLRLGAWLVRKNRAMSTAARKRVLALFPILDSRYHQQAGNLSGGEQQMLSLAMALMVTPKVLMIDELSLGLAPTIVAQLMDVVAMLHRDGTTIVVVEQSVNVALELAQRAVFLEKGEVRFSGPTAELLDRPDILRSVFIAGASAVTNGQGGDGADQDMSRTHEVQVANPAAALGGGVLTRVAPDANASVVLECRGVIKRFGGITAVNDVHIGLRNGEILGLIGHNGAGKTTLFDLMSGFLPLDGGQILLGGMNIGTWPAHMRATAGLGRTFQEARLFPSLTVQETIAVAFERHLFSRDLIAAGLRLPASLDSEYDVSLKVDELVTLMGLGAFAEKLVGELSTGTRRIVELACVLAQDPAVLLLDEPSGGVAQRETEAMGPLLQRVQIHSGCSILVVEHDMPLLTAICDRMIALELGEVIAEGTPAEVLDHPLVVESYLGTKESAIQRSGVGALR
ncbi:MAG TPA: ATP-binding cassette domain-containing protein [Acidimicrobiales bacterium]|nr:ATP-binding cassette domain-containing protein [Acidimicrobiales bacterium]